VWFGGRFNTVFFGGDKSWANAGKFRPLEFHEILLSHWLSGKRVNETQFASLTPNPSTFS